MSSAVADVRHDDDTEYYTSDDFDDFDEPHSDSSKASSPSHASAHRKPAPHPHSYASSRSRSSSRLHHSTSTHSSQASLKVGCAAKADAQAKDASSGEDGYDEDDFENEEERRQPDATDGGARDAPAVAAWEEPVAPSPRKRSGYDSDDLTRSSSFSSSMSSSTSSSSSRAVSRHSSTASPERCGGKEEVSVTHRRSDTDPHVRSTNAADGDRLTDGPAVSEYADDALEDEDDTRAPTRSPHRRAVSINHASSTGDAAVHSTPHDSRIHKNSTGRAACAHAPSSSRQHEHKARSCAPSSCPAAAASSSSRTTSRPARRGGAGEGRAPRSTRPPKVVIAVEAAEVPQTDEALQSMKQANAALYDEIAQLLRARCHSLQRRTHTSTLHGTARSGSRGRGLTVQEQSARVVHEALQNSRSTQLLRQEHRDLLRYSEALQDVVHQRQRATRYAHWLHKARAEVTQLRAQQRERKLLIRQNGKLLLKSHEQSDPRVDEAKRLSEELRARQVLCDARLTRAVADYEDVERLCQPLRERVGAREAELQEMESALPEAKVHTLRALWRERAETARAVRALTRRKEALERRRRRDQLWGGEGSPPHRRVSPDHTARTPLHAETSAPEANRTRSGETAAQASANAAKRKLSGAHGITFSSVWAERDYLVLHIEHMKGVLARRSRGGGGGGAGAGRSGSSGDRRRRGGNARDGVTVRRAGGRRAVAAGGSGGQCRGGSGGERRGVEEAHAHKHHPHRRRTSTSLVHTSGDDDYHDDDDDDDDGAEHDHHEDDDEKANAMGSAAASERTGAAEGGAEVIRRDTHVAGVSARGGAQGEGSAMWLNESAGDKPAQRIGAHMGDEEVQAHRPMHASPAWLGGGGDGFASSAATTPSAEVAAAATAPSTAEAGEPGSGAAPADSSMNAPAVVSSCANVQECYADKEHDGYAGSRGMVVPEEVQDGIAQERSRGQETATAGWLEEDDYVTPNRRTDQSAEHSPLAIPDSVVIAPAAVESPASQPAGAEEEPDWLQF